MDLLAIPVGTLCIVVPYCGPTYPPSLVHIVNDLIGRTCTVLSPVRWHAHVVPCYKVDMHGETREIVATTLRPIAPPGDSDAIPTTKGIDEATQA